MSSVSDKHLEELFNVNNYKPFSGTDINISDIDTNTYSKTTTLILESSKINNLSINFKKDNDYDNKSVEEKIKLSEKFYDVIKTNYFQFYNKFNLIIKFMFNLNKYNVLGFKNFIDEFELIDTSKLNNLEHVKILCRYIYHVEYEETKNEEMALKLEEKIFNLSYDEYMNISRYIINQRQKK